MTAKDKKGRRFLSDGLPVVLYCLLLFIQSANPPVVRKPLFPFADKAAHMGMYAVLGILFFRAFKTPSTKRLRAVFWAIAASTLYGISDEVHQAYVPSRTAEAADVLADGLGSLLGIGAFCFFFPAFREKAPPEPEPEPEPDRPKTGD